MLSIEHHIIIGTAGHIDHGKTSLIKALTGVNTDRLEEEQRRGISIVLGFAEMQLPSGIQAGIVDVPGHERFVRNMLAGAAGIDLVLFLIAADEGVMPQTVEHLEILELLGVQRGLIVLSKVDMVEADWLALVEEDVRTFLKGTFLADAPMVKVSATTGEGLPGLITEIDQVAQQLKPRSDSGIPRLPIDRVFSLPGIGTVATGTLWSGQLKLNSQVEIQPTNFRCKIRNIQVHDRDTTIASAGQRTALALQGIERSQLTRGDVVTVIDALQPTYMIDVRLKPARSLPHKIKTRQKVHFHHGTSEVIGTVVLLDCEELDTGQSALAQIRLDAPVVVMNGDRFVIRQYSPVVTIGGGAILDVHPPKHKSRQHQVAATLADAERADFPAVIAQLAHQTRFVGANMSDIASRFSVSMAELRQLLTQAGAEANLYFDASGQIMHGEWFTELQKRAIERLSAYHQRYPLREGALPLDIKTELPAELPDSIFQKLVETLRQDGRLEFFNNLIRLPDFKMQMSGEAEARGLRLISLLDAAGFTPPETPELPTEFDGELIRYLVHTGKLVRINTTFLLSRAVYQRLLTFLDTYFATQPTMPVAAFREGLGISRKYAVPILEYLDQHSVTIRDGDVRRKGVIAKALS